MDYIELKNILGNIKFKLFHEVHSHKDYYFCFLRKKDLNSKLISLIDKNQSISKKDFQKICHSQTADIMEMADDKENDAYVFFVDILDITAPNYIKQSLFLYKHIANIVSFKFFNSYFDEKTFKEDLRKVIDNPSSFNYIKKGKSSPSGLEISLGNYDMNDYNANSNTKTPQNSPADALNNYHQSKNSIDNQFNLKDFEKIGLKKSAEKDLSDKFFERVDNTASFVADVFNEATINIHKTVKEKAPVVKKNAKVVSKFIGKKIIKAVNEGAKILDNKMKQDKFANLKNNDLFDLDEPLKKENH